MRLFVGLASCLCASALSQSLANDSTSPAAATPSSAATSTAPAAAQPATATQAASSTSAPATAPKSHTPEFNEAEKRLLAADYSLEVHRGERFYCHIDTPLGSRFQSKSCRTLAQIQKHEQDSKDMLNKIQRESMTPTGH